MIKKAIRKWLIPDYMDSLETIAIMLTELEEAKKAVSVEGKDIEIKGPVVFLGSLKDCKVILSPTIKPTIVLSKFEMDSMLHFTGSYSTISNNIMSGVEKAVYLDVSK